jgi:hypothetical protein
MLRRSGGRVVVGEERSSPSISIMPSVGRMKPAIMRSVVVLPQPDGPSSVRNSPARAVSETLSTARVAP